MEIYTARSGFVVMHDGKRTTVHQGDTTVEGHWLLDQCAEAFEPFEVTHPLEPGRREKAAAEKAARAAAEQAAAEADAAEREAAHAAAVEAERVAAEAARAKGAGKK